MRTAFTFGRKLRYKDLDDPHYRSNIMMERRLKKLSTADNSRKELAVINESLLIDEDTMQSPLRKQIKMSYVDSKSGESFVQIKEDQNESDQEVE